MTTIQGLVVIQRKAEMAKRGRRPGYGWTLHRDDCGYVQRATEVWPAPDPAYPETVPCGACKPLGGHAYSYTRGPDGRWRAACSGCPLESNSTSRDGARTQLAYRHRRAEVKAGEVQP